MRPLDREHPQAVPGPIAAKSKPDTLLLEVMQSELTRAMKSLGSSAAPDPTAKNQPQPKPYFISYGVSDSSSVSMSAQFGALTGENESHHRTADVQVRLGSEAEDNNAWHASQQRADHHAFAAFG